MFDECAGNHSHKRLKAVAWLIVVIGFFAIARWVYIHNLDRTQKTPDLVSECRADWMSGKYGVMVHWVFADAGNADELTDSFDLEGFLADFDKTGADWLIFPFGQNRGAYAAPSATIAKYCGDKVGLPKRDLMGELAAAMHKRGKRFIAYLPSEVRGNPVKELVKWDESDPHRTEFEKVWTEVIREWAVRYGKNLDGWWLDGYYRAEDVHDSWPEDLNEDLWAPALRAGNPNCAVAINSGILEVKHKPEWHIARLRPRAKTLPDYLAGELNYIKDGKCFISPWENTYWMPEGKYVEGTKILNHVLFPMDGAWGMYWPWAKNLKPPFLESRPEMTDAAALKAMEARGETPAPIVDRECLEDFIKGFTSVGGAVTVNIGIDRKGRMNPKSLEYFSRLADEKNWPPELRTAIEDGMELYFCPVDCDAYENLLALEFKTLKGKADAGNALAAAMVGISCVYGEHSCSNKSVRFPIDLKEGFRYVRMAVDKGCKEAKTSLGQMYMYGLGTPTNYMEAVKLFTEVSGFPENYIADEARFHLVRCYTDGLGVEKDLAKAEKLCREIGSGGFCYGKANEWLWAHDFLPEVLCSEGLEKFAKDYRPRTCDDPPAGNRFANPAPKFMPDAQGAMLINPGKNDAGPFIEIFSELLRRDFGEFRWAAVSFGNIVIKHEYDEGGTAKVKDFDLVIAIDSVGKLPDLSLRHYVPLRGVEPQLSVAPNGLIIVSYNHELLRKAVKFYSDESAKGSFPEIATSADTAFAVSFPRFGDYVRRFIAMDTAESMVDLFFDNGYYRLKDFKGLDIRAVRTKKGFLKIKATLKTDSEKIAKLVRNPLAKTVPCFGGYAAKTRESNSLADKFMILAARNLRLCGDAKTIVLETFIEEKALRESEKE